MPGKIDSPTSAGTNQLIKQGAKLVEKVEDVLDELVPLLGELPLGEAKPAGAAGTAEATAGLSNGERAVYEILTSDPIHIDEIIRHTGQTPAQAASTLMMLEIKSLIEQLAGKFFVKR